MLLVKINFFIFILNTKMNSLGTRRTVVPLLVSDENLKRARTEVNGEDVIRVTSTGTDPQDIANAAGLAPAKIDADSVSAKLDRLVTKATTNASNTSTLSTTTGSVSDAAWTGTGNATVISLLKGIVNKLQ